MTSTHLKDLKFCLWIFIAGIVLWPVYVHFIGPVIFTPGAESKRVVIYTASWCGYCKQVRSFLDASGITYDELDIEGSTRNYLMFKSLGGMGVPLVVVGDEVIRGYRPDAITRKLNTLGYQIAPVKVENDQATGA